MTKEAEIKVKKTIYKLTDEQILRKALQDITDMFTPKELEAISKKLKSPIVQMQIRSML